MPDPLVETRDVEFSYPDGTRALQGISLAIPAGSKTAILGPNGAGKTTLFLTLNGLLRPAKGRVRFSGEDVCYNRAGLRQLRQNVGIVFQDPDTQLFAASVRQEISFGPLNMRLAREEVERRVEEALAATGITHLADRPTHLLSYGEKKRVAIADILAMQPRVLIADEPTAWLDARHAREIMQLFSRINQGGGVTLVYSTHDVDLAYSYSDYVVIIKAGRVIGEGVPVDIFQNCDLLAHADLTLPWLVEVYQGLRKSGRIRPDLPVPKTKEELLRQSAIPE